MNDSWLLSALREIEDSKLFVIIFCCLVIRSCGVDFVVEVADVFVYAVVAYLDIPFPLGFVPGTGSCAGHFGTFRGSRGFRHAARRCVSGLTRRCPC